MHRCDVFSIGPTRPKLIVHEKSNLVRVFSNAWSHGKLVCEHVFTLCMIRKTPECFIRLILMKLHDPCIGDACNLFTFKEAFSDDNALIPSQPMTSFSDTESSVTMTSSSISDDTTDISIMDDNLVRVAPKVMLIVYQLNITDSPKDKKRPRVHYRQSRHDTR